MPEIIATHYHRGVQNKGPSIHNRIWYCIYSNLLVFFFAICTCASQMSLCFSLFLTLGSPEIQHRSECWMQLSPYLLPARPQVAVGACRSGSCQCPGWPEPQSSQRFREWMGEGERTSRTKTASLEILFTIALTGKLTWPGGFHQWTSDMQLKSTVNVHS